MRRDGGGTDIGLDFALRIPAGLAVGEKEVGFAQDLGQPRVSKDSRRLGRSPLAADADRAGERLVKNS
jgi:hypothetical protein